MHTPRRRLLTAFALIAILGFAAAVRLYGLEWDDNHHLHPDERFLTIVSDKIRFPSNPLDYFDTRRSPLNPYNARDVDAFAYGMVPLFLTRALAEWYSLATYDGIPKVGRVLSALFDVGTVLVVFLLGRIVYGRGVGLVAAALSAATVIHIQLSHFYAVDTFLAFATTLALYAAYRAWLRWGYLSFLLLGFAAGLALAMKLSAALLAPIVLLAAVLPPPDGRQRRAPAEIITMFAVCGVAALVTYRVCEPYSFLGPGFFGLMPNMQRFDDLNRWVKISSGEIEVPFMIQWANTPNPRFALTSIVEWGLGPVAGIISFIGLAVAALELRCWSRYSRNVLLVVWAAINLGYFGFQFAKFMRYFLPVYPALAVLAGYLLVRVLPRLCERWRLSPTLLPRIATTVVVTATVLFALAFTSIYSRPNTRVTASEWILQNVPAGSTLGVEHWDDSLPLRLPGYDKKLSEVSLTLYDDESPEKARKLAQALDKADYVVLASNRLHGSIPKLPRRYPIAIEYYDALFDGRLGFDQVAQFDSHPGLFGITIDSSSAQEDFTVYDHPTVMIFKKADRFSGPEVSRLLGAVPLDQLERTKPVDAGARKGLMLSPEEWQQVQTHGTWHESFTLDGVTTTLAVPLWLLAVEILGLAAFPLCWLLLPGLADRGYGVARILGLLLVSYAAWLAASVGLAPFGRGLVYISLILLVVASSLVLRLNWQRFRGDLREVRPRLLAVELTFLASLALMLTIRALNPDLWHPTFGGEKPMDFAYLNAVVKTPSFPPYDPWFAGGYINYYYYGFVLVAALIQLTAVPPVVAYNLAVGTIFALTASAAFSVAISLVMGSGGRRGLSTRAIIAGVGSALALCVLGNLDGALQLLEGLWKLGGNGVESGVPAVTGLTRALAGLMALAFGASPPSFDYWRSTRFIGPEDPGPIHEFPFFTFLYGDLHAHMVSMPIQVAAIAVGLQAVRLTRREIVGAGGLREPAFRRAALRLLARPLALVFLTGLIVGTLRATNTWELPTYLALAGLLSVIATRPGRWVRWPVAAAVGAIVLGAVYLVSSATFAPFLARYELFYSGVVPVKTPTSPTQFLLINGALLFVVISYLAYGLARSATVARALTSGAAARVPTPAARYLSTLAPPITLAGEGHVSPLALALLALGLILWGAGYGTLGILVLAGGIVGGVAVYRRASREMLFMAGIAAAALGSLALPEIVAVKGDVGRMNTVFKFYLQAWILLAILAGPSGVLVWRALFRNERTGNAKVAPCSDTGRPTRPDSDSPPGDGERPVAGAADELAMPVKAAGLWRYVWGGAVILLVAACMVYPILATPTKVGLRFAPLPPTLDGMAYMADATYRDRGRDLNLPADWRAIRWLLENVEGTPVILEGSAPLYHWGSRYSIYTGLPTVLGWDWHQKQQRTGYTEKVDQRQREVNRFYETADVEAAWETIHKYGVRYVVVGGLERAYYPTAGLAKFDRMAGDGLAVVYRDEGVTIYRVEAP
jgi:YYY domain-containing protein